jgi:hypothetical protein
MIPLAHPPTVRGHDHERFDRRASPARVSPLQLVTLGGLGIWALYDLIMIVVGSFTDSNGVKITQWT